jgi:hypothetical protein
MLKSSFGGLVLATIFGVASAQAAPCSTTPTPSSVYTAPGFTCTVGTLTFSGVSISPSTTGTGVVGPISITALSDGLPLTFSASASAPPPSTADISWLYDVTSTVPIVDASLLLTGSGTSGGAVTLDETLSNGATLHASSPGSATDTVTFAGVSSLSVAKDLANVALTPSSLSVSSVVENTFSTSTHPIPEPAAFVVLGAGLVGLGLARRKTVGSDGDRH